MTLRGYEQDEAQKAFNALNRSLHEAIEDASGATFRTNFGSEGSPEMTIVHEGFHEVDQLLYAANNILRDIEKYL